MEGHTLGDVIAAAMEFEAGACKMYKALSERFAHDARASAFWNELSQDEAEHVELLTALREALPQHRLESQAPAVLVSSVEEVRAFVTRHDPGAALDLNEALEMAYELEAMETIPVFRMVALEGVPEAVRERFLTTQIDEHIRKIDVFRQNHANR